jgi:hypothetical protein
MYEIFQKRRATDFQKRPLLHDTTIVREDKYQIKFSRLLLELQNKMNKRHMNTGEELSA